MRTRWRSGRAAYSLRGTSRSVMHPALASCTHSTGATSLKTLRMGLDPLLQGRSAPFGRIGPSLRYARSITDRGIDTPRHPRGSAPVEDPPTGLADRERLGLRGGRTRGEGDEAALADAGADHRDPAAVPTLGAGVVMGAAPADLGHQTLAHPLHPPRLGTTGPPPAGPGTGNVS